MMIHNRRYIFRVLFFFAICLLLFATRSVFAADEAMTLGAGTKGAGPVAYWNFDEAGGPTAYDKTGNGNDGTLNAGATGANTTASQMWSPEGKFGGCLEFDGDDDWVEVGDKASLDVGTSDFTIETWVKFAEYEPDGWDDGVIVKVDFAAPRHGYMLAIRGSSDATNKNKPLFWIGLGDASGIHLFGTSVINDGVWHHLVGTADRDGYMKLYRDGALESQKDISSYSAQNEDNTKSLQIGGRSGSTSIVNGLIDEVRIYNRALTADEVRMAYNAGAAAHLGSTTSASYDPWGGDPPVGWWSLDENTGITAYDRSGSGNDGTITGATWAHGKHGPALDFDGTDDYVIYASCPTITETLTVTAWVYPRSYPTERACLLVGHTPWAYFFSLSSDGSLQSYWYGTTPAGYHSSGANTVPLDTWSYLTVTWDGSYAKLYVNGIEKNSVPVTGNGTQSTGYYVGAQATSRRFDGLIDEVKIYDYARTQAQVAWDYNKGGSTAHLGAGTVSRGRSSDTACTSCKAIKDACSQCPDGVYWIDPDGTGGGDPFQVYCDMTTDGGGWTIVGTNKNNGDASHMAISKNDGININSSTIPAISTLDNVTQEGYIALKYWNSIAETNELRFVVGANTLIYQGWQLRSDGVSDWLHSWTWAECNGPQADKCWSTGDSCGFTFDTPGGSRSTGAICYAWPYLGAAGNEFMKSGCPTTGTWFGWYHSCSRYNLVGNNPGHPNPEWMDAQGGAAGDSHIALR